MSRGRIAPEDSVEDAAIKLAIPDMTRPEEVHMKSLVILSRLAELGDLSNPSGTIRHKRILMHADELGLYGDKPWKLYNLICDEDMEKMSALVSGCHHHIGITAGPLSRAIKAGWAHGFFDVDDVVRQVQDRIPGYKKILPDLPAKPGFGPSSAPGSALTPQ
ncbi:MAG: hypothetical protein WDO70_09300 [Alphaproteobacteria bacterium]